MRIELDYSLERHNTFRLPAKAHRFIEYENEEELSRILRDDSFHSMTSFSIGEGSNILFVNDFNGTILHSRIRGVTIVENTSDTILLRVGAAELWDDVVAFSVSNGWGGIENLSLIPGVTGAAAVQNIGAYGVEIKDVVEKVEAFNQLSGEKRIFTNKDCRYGYRHSYFKEKNHETYIVTSVEIRLQKTPQYKLAYGNLKEMLKGITLQAVRDAIIKIRREKLPDPQELSNAGSFFMNPVIPQSQFNDLLNKYPAIPNYPAPDNNIKIPAGWLIEQCGFKGKREGNVGVYEKQALVLVNYGGATGQEIASFASSIQQAVYQKFNIPLTPEVLLM